ncbi:hypothetical protein EVAR_34561_1 [Eumeta japonica]|uniref:Uncharacterized protein n=1 Tax=Eumeta variegata TaxID=151549 RepID=A0A4C1X4A1_EUMVA|nr:hypothetical protein EVAR_34561_1 [Eumeta japonica]
MDELSVHRRPSNPCAVGVRAVGDENKINNSATKRGMKVDVVKTKVMVLKGDIERRVNAKNKVNVTLLAVMSSKSVSRQARLAIQSSLQRVLIATLMYASESWIWQKKNGSWINAVEIRSLRSMCGVSGKIHEETVMLCNLNEDVVIRVERDMLRCSRVISVDPLPPRQTVVFLVREACEHQTSDHGSSHRRRFQKLVHSQNAKTYPRTGSKSQARQKAEATVETGTNQKQKRDRCRNQDS